MNREAAWYFGAIVALFVMLLAWLAAAPASAQMLCGPRREVINALKQSANETEIWSGKHSGSEPLVMLLLSGKNGTWTLVAVKPDVACVIGAGSNSTLIIGVPA